jgi:1-phosphofructokinase
LNPSLDKTFFVDRLLEDEVCRALEVRVDPGGKGINVARALSALGSEVLAYGLVGGFTGQALEKLLLEEGLAFYFVRGTGETRENLLIHERESGHQFKINAPGPLFPPEDLKKLAEKLFSPCEFLVFSGSLPEGLPKATYRELIDMARIENIPTLLDCDGPPLLEGLLARPNVLKLNQQEFERMAGRSLEEPELLAEARGLIRRGIEMVVVSSGAKFVYAVSRDEAWRALPPVIEAVCPVGAGDAMAAGLVFKLAAAAPFFEAVRFCVAAGTAGALTPGNQRIDGALVHKLLPLVEMAKL